MSDLKAWLSEWVDPSVLPFVPPSLIGAFIGWRWAQEQTQRQRAGSFLISTVLSSYATAAVAENLHWGTATLALVAILGAVVGMDLIGGLVVSARQWKADPQGTFGRWWATWLGRGGTPPNPPPAPEQAPQPPQGGDPMRRDS